MRPESARTFLVPILTCVVLAGLLGVPSYAATTNDHRGHQRVAAQRVSSHSLQPAPAAQPGRRRDHPQRVAMTIGTYNLRAGMSLRKFHKGVRALRRHVGVAGLQEIGANRRHYLLAATRGWGYYRPRNIQQNPVIWNRHRFRLVEGRGHRIAKSRHLRNQLPGSKKRKKDSTATVVRLRHRATGRKISVINVHLVHGAVKGGKPWPGRPAVFGLYRDQVRGLVRAVRHERRWGRVFVVGDFNVGYRADRRAALPKLPYRQLSRLKLNSMWQGSRYLRHHRGTHSDALIDQIWSKRKPVHVRILRGIRPSDHFPATATYRLRRAHHRR